MVAMSEVLLLTNSILNRKLLIHINNIVGLTVNELSKDL